MKEFAQKGFNNASTNEIVKEAGISKGLLFHYFKNKKDLFLFLYDYAMDVLMNEMMVKFNREEKDIFARRRQAALMKMEILGKYPEIYSFLAVAYMDDSVEVKSEMESRNKKLIATGQSFLNEGIDTSKFKEGIDVKRAIDIITWTFEGLVNRETQRLKSVPAHEINYDELFSEMDIYLEMLKNSFYK